MKRARLVAAALGALASVALPMSSSYASSDDRSEHAFDTIRDATSDYRDIALAEEDGFTLHLTTKDGVACISQPGQGAMGEHLVNTGRVGDGVISRRRPEVLLYSPHPDGSRTLLGVEYVVFVSDWIKTHSSPPSLWGHEFGYTGADNPFGLPPYYSLHAWAYKHNPSGDFYAWNPRVTCP